ncbi:MAG TPA: DUF4265 domain-containing protein [Flavipsychrobacter sp.]|nr:DUF4265 domain-containing protein [Flavipsychrobacter sp.]
MTTRNHLLKMLFPYTNEEGNELNESMWVKQIGEYYEIDNIPFYVKNYACGDLVSGEMRQGELIVEELIQESGNSTIQIIFYDKGIIEKTRASLKELKCASEISNIPALIAFNVPKDVDYFGVVEPFLQSGFKADLWDYQEACLAHT